MDLRNIAVVLSVALSASIALAQSEPPSAPQPPSNPTPPEAPATPTQPTTVEGTLMKSQRANNDRGKYEWVCTYRVAGTTRNVLLEESCPQTLPFSVRK